MRYKATGTSEYGTMKDKYKIPSHPTIIVDKHFLNNGKTV